MQSLLGELVDSVLAMPDEFATVATSDPLSAVLLVVGALFVVVSVGAFGYLTAGAALELVTPEISGPEQPGAGR